jgi:hypothetical protein
MSGINKTGEVVEGNLGEAREVRISGDLWEWDIGEGVVRDGAPVDQTPIFSSAKVLCDLEQGGIVFTVGTAGHATEKCDCITNVQATYNEGIHEFPKDLAIGEAYLLFESTVLLCPFLWALKGQELGRLII